MFLLENSDNAPSLVLAMANGVTTQPCNLFRPKPLGCSDKRRRQKHRRRHGKPPEHGQCMNVVVQPAIVERHHAVALIETPLLIRPQTKEFGKRDHGEMLLQELHVRSEEHTSELQSPCNLV